MATLAPRTPARRVAPPAAARAPSSARPAHDTGEREAEQRARRALQTRPPAVAAPLEPAAPGPGQALPASVRRAMEPRFQASFAAVRVHTGERAAQASRQLNARAFTRGREVFFGAGEYQPESPAGQELLAHELAHTLQQAGAAPRVQRWGLGDALAALAERAPLIPGYRLLGLVLGADPVTGRAVARSGAQLLRAVIELWPAGVLATEALDRHGVLDRAGMWAEQQAQGARAAVHSVREALLDFLNGLSWDDVTDPAALWDRAARLIREPADRLRAWAASLEAGLAELVREALLMPLATQLQGTAAYPLLCAVLGADPVSGAAVARTPAALIGGFMALIGRADTWEAIQQSAVVAQAMAWFERAQGSLLGFARELPGAFQRAFGLLAWADLRSLPQVAGRMLGVFGDLGTRFGAWASEAVWGLLDIVANAVAPGLLPALGRGAALWRQVLRDPFGAGMNLLRAVQQGLWRFAGNLAEHLQRGLAEWLASVLSGAGLHLPRSFEPRELALFALSVCDAGWAALRERLVRQWGEPAVRAMEGGFALVRTLARDGPVAAWAQLREALPPLAGMVGPLMLAFVSTRLVQPGIAHLMTWLGPLGPTLVGAFQGAQRVLGVLTGQVGRIAAFGATVLGGAAEWLSGAVQAVAARAAQVLGQALSPVLDLLGRLLGLGGIGPLLRAAIQRVRGVVNAALDRLVAWVVEAARRAGRLGGGDTASRIRWVLGRRLFHTRESDWVELPADLSPGEAVQLEAEGSAAQARIERAGPRAAAPRPRAAAARPIPRLPLKPARRGGRVPRGPAGAAAAAAAMQALATKGAGERPVARYLVAQGMPALQRGAGRLQALKANEQTHDSAAAKRGQADQAVVIPRSEEQSQGHASQVEQVGARPAPRAEPARAKAELGQALRRHIPKTLEDVDRFRADAKAQRMVGEVVPLAHGDKDAVLATFGDLRQTPAPVPTEHVPQPLPATDAAPATAALALGAGLIAPLRPEHLDTRAYTDGAQKNLANEGVTQEQLDMVDSGDLAEARREKQGLEKAARSEPLAAQALARQEAQRTDTGLRADELRERRALHGQRAHSLGATAKRQRDTRSALEKEREAVAARINGMAEATQTLVKKRLADLESTAMRRFDDGNRAAADRFERQVNADLDAYKDDRYSGFFGRLRKARDWLLGMDDLPGVKRIFERNRAVFVDTVQRLVDDIAADNQRVVAECKAQVAATEAAIKSYVAGLKPSLRGVGDTAAKEMGERLRALDQFVAKKEGELKQQLLDKQQAAIKAIDEKIEKMKEAMAGALAKLGKLLLWAAKKFFTWALGQFGLSLSDIESIISKGAAVLKAIFTGPIRFVKNLIKAAKDGFASFREHFPSHLKDALFEWLTGSLTGVRLPTVWNTRGVVDVALQVLRLSGDAVRRKLLLKLGGDARLVAQIERATPLVAKVLTEGPAAACEEIKAEAAEVEREVIGKLREFVIVEIVKRAVTTVLQMFIPGAGIVRAIIGIYDTIVFFIQKAADIARMVGNFLGSIADIAAGNTASAAAALEAGLARALKLVIEFLARFLRLGGIPGRIRAVIDAVAGRVERVIDAVVEWIARGARRGAGAVASGAKKAVAAVVQWWRTRRAFGQGKNRHTLHFVGEGTAARLAVSSQTKGIRKFIDEDVRTKVPASHPKAALLPLIDQQVVLVEARTGNGNFGEQAGKEIAAAMNQIADLLEQLGGVVPESKLVTQDTETLPDGSLVGKTMVAEPLSIRPGKLHGSAPLDETPTWRAVNRRVKAYVQGHLLNHHLYGPGRKQNMVPISRSLNGTMSAQAEEKVKQAVHEKGKVVRYSVHFDYGGHTGPRKLPQELYLPSQVTLQADEVVPDGSGWKPVAPVVPKLPLPHRLPPDDHPIDVVPVLQRLAINRPQSGRPGDPSARTALLNLYNVGEERADRLLAHIGNGSKASFKSWDDVEAVVKFTGIVDFWKEQMNTAAPPQRLVYFHGETVWSFPPP